MVTFVALGDSATAGFGDPMPEGGWRGWAALLAEGLAPPSRPTAKTLWMATRGTRWLLDRSTDLIPYLLRTALAEWWFDIRGIAHRLDEAFQAEITTALHGLDAAALPRLDEGAPA